jgi:hypothetical protein
MKFLVYLKKFFNYLNIDYSLCGFRPSSIAIASILLMTENKSFFNFRDSWFNFIKSEFKEINIVSDCQVITSINL